MSEQRRRGPMGGHGRMMSGEKAKDFKGSMAKLFRYMGRYKFRFILMFIFAVMAVAVDGWDSLGYLFLAIFTGLMLIACGMGWGIWMIFRFLKKK
mgnify:CR=1 FL=1